MPRAELRSDARHAWLATAGVVLGLVAACGSPQDGGRRAAAPPSQPVVPPASGAADVADYDIDVSLDLTQGAIEGRSRITVDVGTAQALELDAHGLSVTGVTEGGRPLAHEQGDDTLRITLASSSSPHVVEIGYTARPTRGLVFSHGSAYTVFHTLDWMPCRMDPSDRATASVAVTAETGVEVVSVGDPAGDDPLPGGQTRHRFRLDVPYPAYVIGFVAGQLTSRERMQDEITYRDYSVAHDTAELERLFVDTPRMMVFFEERSGVRYPLHRFSQVIADPGSGEEHAGFSLLTRQWADSALADPTEDYLAAHELSHQVWGNLVTCADWDHFWLNEAFAVFMTAAWKEHRWGRAAYDREMALARERWARLRAAGQEHALTGGASVWTTSGFDPLPYTKGAAVLGYLRYLVGDTAFWEGVRRYSHTGAGHGVRTEDLERAMPTAPGGFFDRWTRRAGAPEVSASWRVQGDELELRFEQRGEPWPLRVPVAVEDAAGAQRRDVQLHSSADTVRVPAHLPLVGVRIDPDGVLPVAIAVR